jgi:hypothetical protein
MKGKMVKKLAAILAVMSLFVTTLGAIPISAGDNGVAGHYQVGDTLYDNFSGWTKQAAGEPTTVGAPSIKISDKVRFKSSINKKTYFGTFANHVEGGGTSDVFAEVSVVYKGDFSGRLAEFAVNAASNANKLQKDMYRLFPNVTAANYWGAWQELYWLYATDGGHRGVYDGDGVYTGDHPSHLLPQVKIYVSGYIHEGEDEDSFAVIPDADAALTDDDYNWVPLNITYIGGGTTPEGGALSVAVFAEVLDGARYIKFAMENIDWTDQLVFVRVTDDRIILDNDDVVYVGGGPPKPDSVVEIADVEITGNLLRSATLATLQGDPVPGSFLAAAYDADGLLSDVKVISITAGSYDANNEAFVPINLTIPSGGNPKVFFLDSLGTLSPITESK